MKILLDTSAYSALHRGDPRVLAVLQRSKSVALPVIALGELYSGFRAGTRRQENEVLLAKFLSKPTVTVLDVTADTTVRYAEIDVFLRGKGRPIPRNDVWIAALAMEHGLVLVTLDAHFNEIPFLLIEPARARPN